MRARARVERSLAGILGVEENELLRLRAPSRNGDGDRLDIGFARKAASLALDAQGEKGVRGVVSSLAEAGDPLCWYVAARFSQQCGDADRALELLDKCIGDGGGRDHRLLLEKARLLVRASRYLEAMACVQAALADEPPYQFFAQAEKVVEKIIASGAWTPRRQARLALIGSSTTSFLAPVLRAAGLRRGLLLDVYEGPYGSYRQEILDPASGLYAFRPDVTAIMVNRRDLALPPVGGLGRAREFVHELRSLWKILQDRNPCHIVQAGLDAAAESSWGSLEYALPEGRRRVLQTANLLLSEDLPSGVSFLDVDAIALRLGGDFQSDQEWHAFRQHPATAALPSLAAHICSHVTGALGLAGKVLVLDLDNTLWGGVIGEDLLDGIRIGPPTAEGEAYRELQSYAKELKQKGVLLAVCSKNNPEDARQPFDRHDSMRLRYDDFVAFTANWQDKAANIEAMAKDLSLGLESFVFLDDNPIERAWVRARLPQVCVPECSPNPWDLLRALKEGLYFESVRLTEEDLRRHDSYKGNLARKTLAGHARSLDDFLLGLEMEAAHGPVGPETIQRVTQLINKTNQFNLTTRRYSEEQVAAMAGSDEWWCRWFRLADKFGDHGLIGVVLARREGTRLDLDTWLMSCRVLGRRMEEFMFAAMLDHARESGVAEIVGTHVPTAKNAPVGDLLPRLGFEPMEGCPGSFVYPCGTKEFVLGAFFGGAGHVEAAARPILRRGEVRS